MKKKVTKIILGVMFAFLFTFIWLPTTKIEAAGDITTPKLSVPIGGFSSFSPVYQLTCDNGKAYCIDWIGQYIRVVFQYGVGLAAVLAVVMIMVGGFIWLTSGGSPDKVGKAKEYITSSLLGLFLALFSYSLLYALNPNLVNIQAIKIEKIVAVNFLCCKNSSTGVIAKIEIVSDKAQCPTGYETLPNISCGTQRNQACPSPSIIVQSRSSDDRFAYALCDNVCSGRPDVRAAVRLTSGDGTLSSQICCTCNSDNNSCKVETENGCSKDSDCCPGLICNTAYLNECLRPGQAGRSCNFDTECASQICNHANLNHCTPLGGSVDGVSCERHIECSSKFCNPYCDRCTKPGGKEMCIY
ncbi:MAG: hypothetical protein JW816_00300 [Candidatus Buchananbacteria bacterium]|nr:hypothetical protein [Candidatus Buchananbacteria bacterium]